MNEMEPHEISGAYIVTVPFGRRVFLSSPAVRKPGRIAQGGLNIGGLKIAIRSDN
jgi:hypothetical protein